MGVWISSFSPLEKVYFFSAVIGGALFVVRFLLQIIGGIEDVNLDGVEDLTDSDVSFTLLSFQGITAFFMMFGLVGLALVRENKTSVGISLVGGVIAGLGSVWVIQKIFHAVKSLESSGTINMQNAIGEEGSVYLTIPAEGSGKVQIAVQGSLKVYDAVTDQKQEIQTGQRIKVVRIMSNDIVVVEKI